MVSQAAVRRSSAPAESLPPDSPSSETVSLHVAGSRDSRGRAASKAITRVCSVHKPVRLVFILFFCDMRLQRPIKTFARDRRLEVSPVWGHCGESLLGCLLCCVVCLPLYFALLPWSPPTPWMLLTTRQNCVPPAFGLCFKASLHATGAPLQDITKSHEIKRAMFWHLS